MSAQGRKRASSTVQEVGLKRMRTNGHLLPEDLVISEILSRLPVKSLTRFKCVCKSWQSAISGGDSHLMASHLKRSRQQLRVLVTPSRHLASGVVSYHFVQERTKSSSQSEFLQDMGYLGAADAACRPSHCDGLILFSSANKFHVCNPSTRELITLPTSDNVNNVSRIQPQMLPNNAVAIGLDPVTNKYKVVRFFYRASDLEARTCSLGVEVLTLGSSSLCWIPQQQEPPYPIWPIDHASTDEGVIYWLIDNALHTFSPQAIISYDLRDGKFGVIPPPPTWSEDSLDLFYRKATLGVLDGKLCCTHGSGLLRQVCIYRDGMWHLSHSRQLGLMPLGWAGDGKMLAYDADSGHSFIYYDPRNQTRELIPCSTERWPACSAEEAWLYIQIIPYVESMTPIRSENSTQETNTIAA